MLYLNNLKLFARSKGWEKLVFISVTNSDTFRKFSDIMEPPLMKTAEVNQQNKVFIQKHNPILGCNEWEMEDEDHDYNKEIASSAYADMLLDDERVSLENNSICKSLLLVLCSSYSASSADLDKC